MEHRQTQGRARARRRWLMALLVALVALAFAGVARADGDPGSDVLVYENLFVGTDAGFSIAQQAQLGASLAHAASSGAALRVAVIASPQDLGAVTALWRRPQAYARFLGLELSLAYKQRLLVVMPNGFGFNWPGHATPATAAKLSRVPIGPGRAGLLRATEQAVHLLAPGGPAEPARTTTAPAATPSANGATNPAARNDSRVALIAMLVLAVAGLLAGARLLLRRRPGGPGSLGLVAVARRAPVIPVTIAAVVAAGVVFGAVRALSGSGTADASPAQALATNPNLDPGTSVGHPAADFTLADEAGRPVSLHSFRGKVVILAFTDSTCTTICPLTTTAMLDAKAMLGAAGSQVQLLGVDANPAAITLQDVLSYSQLHGMLGRWHFLTGTLAQLRRVWKSYAISADIQKGLIAHTPALMIIGPDGTEQKVYMTQQSYSAIGQLGQLLAQESSRLLPGHPRVRSDLSYAPIAGVSPATHVSLPRPGGGSVRLGPGAPHLSFFFATWSRETTSLAGHMSALNAYVAYARRWGLPALTAVDEGSVEPSPTALPTFLSHLSLTYPVGVDRAGRVADGYEVLGQPWFVLTSATGKILWYRQVSTTGWPSESELQAQVRHALARAPQTPTSAAGIAAQLAGSPAPLTALHEQAGQLLGSEAGLAARVRALRGYPIVINAWASWCVPCQSEFGLFAAASARFGKRVAFLGADTNDSPGDARTFLGSHPVGYPSYRTTTSDLSPLAVIEGLPTTIFVNAAGKVVSVHTGQYFAQGSLAGDISTYALGG